MIQPTDGERTTEEAPPAKQRPDPPMFPGGTAIGEEEERAVLEVLRDQRLFRYRGPRPGPSRVDVLENALASHIGVRHALAVTRDNYVIHTNLGIELAQRGAMLEALRHLDRAAGIKPDFAMARNNRGNVLLALGRTDAVLAEYRVAVGLDGGNARAQHNLGRALMGQQHWDQAILHLSEAVALEPDHAGARNNLGIALAAAGQPLAAAEQFRDVLRRNPNDELARANLRLLEQQPAPPLPR